MLSYYKSTHTSGHTLDLIISRSINDVIITELESTLALSDHSFIECNLNMPKPNFVAKELRFRQLKRIDIPMFKNDISGSELCVTSFSDIEEFTRCYDTTLLNLLDKHAPIKTKKMVMRPVYLGSLMILKSLNRNDGNAKEKCFNLVVLMIKSFIIRLEINTVPFFVKQSLAIILI